jgi:hypothetical protein
LKSEKEGKTFKKKDKVQSEVMKNEKEKTQGGRKNDRKSERKTINETFQNGKFTRKGILIVI